MRSVSTQRQFEAFVGTTVDDTILADLRKRFGTSLDSAVNAYFDESWKRAPTSPVLVADDVQASVLPPSLTKESSTIEDQASSPLASSATRRFADLSITPVRRYIGALGVTAWATRSGSNLLRSGDKVKIERTRQFLIFFLFMDVKGLQAHRPICDEIEPFMQPTKFA